MNSVKVTKANLRAVVTVNRGKHREEFDRAFMGYKQSCIDALEANLSAFKAGRAERLYLNENPPEDHTLDYDRVLKMLEMSVEDEVTLTAEAFQQYVMDDWGWKQAWAQSTAKYLSK